MGEPIKYRCERSCGRFRQGQVYTLERLDALARGAILAGYLVASGGWCAPSETVYASLPVDAGKGMLALPHMQVERGTIRFGTPDQDKQPEKPRKARKKAAPKSDTLESIGEATAAGLDGLRGPAGA